MKVGVPSAAFLPLGESGVEPDKNSPVVSSLRWEAGTGPFVSLTKRFVR
jgi:hypothetical protein